ncbi:hypothetical protein GCM10009767_33640 [Kocuria aegyptia]|uniref:Uncharacterized protein n=1 Tax=Kocuria aegyptia TaxID=330943 RepID=A0ABN2L3H1_9MICC
MLLTEAPAVSGGVRWRVGAFGGVRGGPGVSSAARQDGHKYIRLADALPEGQGRVASHTRPCTRVESRWLKLS